MKVVRGSQPSSVAARAPEMLPPRRSPARPSLCSIGTSPTTSRTARLEEASALDPGTESALNATLERLRKGRTVVSVTHRLAAIQAATCIFVLAQGRLVESGTHQQLMNEDGHYRQIAEAQLYGDEVVRGADDPSHMRRVQDDRRVSATAAAVRDQQRTEEG